jgi:glycosyltransferase involved in cell wall biosynthesis
MSAPSVSIVIPTYNRAELLTRAIASVQAQTYSAWELIVVDDASTDDTAERVAALASVDPRIRLIRNTGSRGPGGARNAGLVQCRAGWVAFLDSDDIWQPVKLARFVAEAEALPEAVLIGSDYWMVDRDENRRETMLEFIHREMMPWWEKEPDIAAIVPCAAIKADPATLARQDVMLSTQIAQFLWVHTSSAMVRLGPVKHLGGFEESLMQTEDIKLWLQLSELGTVIFIPEPLAIYDITGRDVGTGERYERHEVARKPSLYPTRHYHLELMRRLKTHPRLTAAQRRVLRHQTINGHRRCADAARGIKPIPVVLFHRLAGSHRFRRLTRAFGL